MVANDDFDGKATHVNCFYMHMNFEQKYPKPAILVRRRKVWKSGGAHILILCTSSILLLYLAKSGGPKNWPVKLNKFCSLWALQSKGLWLAQRLFIYSNHLIFLTKIVPQHKSSIDFIFLKIKNLEEIQNVTEIE